MISNEGLNKDDTRTLPMDLHSAKFEALISEIKARTWAPSSRVSNSKFRVLPLALLLALAGAATPAASAFGAQRVWQRSFELPPGGHVSVINVHGSLLVEGWDRSVLEVTVAMRTDAPASKLDDVQVAVEAGSASVAFHTLYPSGGETPVRVDYHLRVPRQICLDELSTLQGDVVVHDVDGSINARDLRGDIEGINVAGSVVAHTLTGNIMMSLRSLPERVQPLMLAAINGNVDLQLPAQANANLELSTVAGSIVSDYREQVSSTPGDSTRRAQVGAGGVRIELHTVRGNIRVGQREDQL